MPWHRLVKTWSHSVVFALGSDYKSGSIKGFGICNIPALSTSISTKSTPKKDTRTFLPPETPPIVGHLGGPHSAHRLAERGKTRWAVEGRCWVILQCKAACVSNHVVLCLVPKNMKHKGKRGVQQDTSAHRQLQEQQYMVYLYAVITRKYLYLLGCRYHRGSAKNPWNWSPNNSGTKGARLKIKNIRPMGDNPDSKHRALRRTIKLKRRFLSLRRTSLTRKKKPRPSPGTVAASQTYLGGRARTDSIKCDSKQSNCCPELHRLLKKKRHGKTSGAPARFQLIGRKALGLKD